MNPPITLTQFSDKEILQMADDTSDTQKKAALIDVVKLRRKVLELKAQSRKK